jgi:ATP-dependent Clp protease adaptor protein ClpS
MSEPRRGDLKSAGPSAGVKTKPKPPETQELPPYKVLLHNDDVNDMDYVIRTIMELTHLSKNDSTLRMWEAHNTGVALLLVTHKERAELFIDQFASKKMTVTIEPA